jgi:CRISPR system Cascade subunit CasD
VTEFLVFTLYGPLASWGEIAMGGARHTAMHPTRSALLGILGAACGIERQDAHGQQALREGYRFGLRVSSFGDPLRDYHTMQYGEPARKQVFRTRRDELENGRSVGTHLSVREYRTDALASVAVQATEGAPMTLVELLGAVQRPHFVLYLGRKSAPPALPLGPALVNAPDMREAIEMAVKIPQELSGILWGRTDTFFWEEGVPSGVIATAVHWRRDDPASRDRWQFARRREWRGTEEVPRV